MSTQRPPHIKDNGHAHIKFGEDPKPNLQKYGYCVVEGVFTQEFCTTTINDMWTWLHKLGTGIKRDDPTTWSDDNWPTYLKAGLIQHTMGQEEFAWKAREHPNVIHTFSQIHGTKDLLTSFDAVTINRPITSGYTKESTASWIHTDQNVTQDKDIYTSPNYSVQGICNFADVGDNDGSLFVAQSSHLLHTKLFNWNKNLPKNHWYVLKAKDLTYLIDNGIKFVKVNAPAGALILFDSRCFHSGCTSMGNTNRTFRYVTYVSQSPAGRATPEDMALKQKAVHNGLTTTHWSSCNIKIFGLPRGKEKPYMTRKQNIPDYEKWTTERKKLAGLLPY